MFSFNTQKLTHVLHRIFNNKTVDRYGLGKELRRYGFYPDFFPITVIGEHGPSLTKSINHEYHIIDSPFYFHSPKWKKGFKENFKIAVRHLSPFIYYRHTNNISSNQQQKGSIFFVSHSTKLIKASFDKTELVRCINNLPDKFKPVTLCVHFNDFRESDKNFFNSHGLSYICLAHSYQDHQIKSFYNVVPAFKYALCNEYTTAILYTTELGIPSSIINCGTVIYENQGNRFISKNKYEIKDIAKDINSELIKSFVGLNETISTEQMKYVYDALSLDKLNSLTNKLIVMLSLYISLLYSIIVSPYYIIKYICNDNQK